VTLVDIEAPVDTTRRNGNGQYLIHPSNGKKLVGFTRATTIAKTLDDSFGLEGHWKSHTLAGAHIDPELAGKAFQALADGDKQAAKKYAEQAFHKAGGNTKRDRGSLVHDYTERKVADPTYVVPELYAADVDAVIQWIADNGFTVCVEWSEHIVLMEQHRIAGRMDFVLHHTATDTYYVGDLKTGSVTYGAIAWAIQLAIYANADCAYVQGDADDGSDDRRLELPPLNRERAIILNAPLDTGTCVGYWLDIATGADLLALCLDVRKTGRLKSKVLTKFEGGDADNPHGEGTAVLTAAPVAVGSVEDNQPVAAPVTDSGDTVSSSPESAIHHQADVAWLINRTTSLVAATSKQHVAQVWPVDIARPGDIKAGTATWDAGDIDVICITLDALEAKNDIPFGDPRPSIAADLAARFDAAVIADRTPPPKLTPASDDDGPAPDDYVAELKRLAGEMQQSPNPDVRARIARAQLWQRDGNTADVPWRTGLGPAGSTPMRVWAIGRAAIACTHLVDLTADDPDAAVRALLKTYCGDHAYTFPVGALFGSLTTDQAIAVWDMAGDNK
jgi:hypothetical protein